MCRELAGGMSGGVSTGQIMKGLECQVREFYFVLEAIESLPRPLGPSFCSTNKGTETELPEWPI